MSASILQIKEGLVGNYNILAHCFHGYNKLHFSSQKLYECLFALALRTKGWEHYKEGLPCKP